MTRPKAKPAELKDKEIICKECQEKCLLDEEDIIECDTCRQWYHRKCLDKTYTKKEWEILTSDNQNIMFKCYACIQDRGDKVNEIKEIKEMLHQSLRDNRTLMKNLERELYKNLDKAIDSKVKELSTKQSFLEQKVENIEKKSADKEEKYEERFHKIEQKLNEKQMPQNTNPEKLEEMIKEVKEAEVSIEKKIKDEVGIYLDNKEEKERKKQNLIIQRLNETEEKEEDQKAKDKEEVRKIIQTTNPELLSELENTFKEDKYIMRLGKKKADRPRPLRVILSDEEMKKDVLRGCRKLKDSDYQHISVQEDLTREEQEKQYKLRQELKKRKQEGEKVCIFRGEIIPEDQHPRNRY